MTIELKEAKRIAKKLADVERWSFDHKKEWTKASIAFVSAGLCPSCFIGEELIAKLGRYQEGDSENHAGRSCCEWAEFFIDPNEPEYELDTWMGDADPGL